MNSKQKKYLYDAFISYNGADTSFVELLEKELEKYKAPKGIEYVHNRHLNIFRYEGDMYGPDYDKAIRKHLANSRKLILICSPGARNSTYVNEEVEIFCEVNSSDNIISLITNGLPNNEIFNQTDEHLKAFPEALCKVQKMPLAKNYQEFNLRKSKVNKGIYESSWHSLLADILDKPVHEVTQRELKRKIRNRNIIISLASIAFVLLASLSGWALIERDNAIKNEKIADEQREIAQDSTIAAQEQREIALKQTKIAQDSTTAAKEQRKIALVQTKIAQDSTIAAQEQREIALKQRKIAQDSTTAAQEQRQIAQDSTIAAQRQRYLADSSRRETERINLVIQAENDALSAITKLETDPISNTISLSIKAYQLFYENYNDTIINEVNKSKTIFEAIYKTIGQNSIASDFELKSFKKSYDTIHCAGLALDKDKVIGKYAYYNSDNNFLNSFEIDAFSKDINFVQLIDSTLLIIKDDMNNVKVLSLPFNKKHLEKPWATFNIDERIIKSSKIDNDLFFLTPNKLFSFNKENGRKNLLEQNQDSYLVDMANSENRVFVIDTKKQISILDINGKLLDDKKTSVEPTIICSSAKIGKLIVGGEDGSLEIFDIQKNSSLSKKFKNNYGNQTRIENITFTNDGKLLIVSHANSFIYIYDTRYLEENNYIPLEINDITDKIRSIEVTNEIFLLVGTDKKKILIYDLDMGRTVKNRVMSSYSRN